MATLRFEIPGEGVASVGIGAVNGEANVVKMPWVRWTGRRWSELAGF
jgi:hypothetical protein